MKIDIFHTIVRKSERDLKSSPNNVSGISNANVIKFLGIDL